MRVVVRLRKPKLVSLGRFGLTSCMALCGTAALFGPARAWAPHRVPRAASPADTRVLRVEAFFTGCQCPARSLAARLIAAADRHGLDWRLLPSIAFVETTGGKAARNNNLFGWASGEMAFRTPDEGVDFVARRLAVSPFYRGKSIDEILRIYNPAAGYAERVKKVMDALSAQPR